MNEQPDRPNSAVEPPTNAGTPMAFRPLRLGPALLLIALMVTARFGPALLEGGPASYWMISVFGPLLCCVLLAIWWLTASRATWKERLFGFLGLIGALALTLVLVHPTMRGPATTYLTLPMGMVGFIFGCALLESSRAHSWPPLPA